MIFYTPLHLTPLLVGCPSDYCLPVWCGKTRIMCLPDGEKSLTCLPVLTECTNMTDRQTDRHHMTAKAALGASIVLQKGNIIKNPLHASKFAPVEKLFCSKFLLQ